MNLNDLDLVSKEIPTQTLQNEGPSHSEISTQLAHIRSQLDRIEDQNNQILRI